MTALLFLALISVVWLHSYLIRKLPEGTQFTLTLVIASIYIFGVFTALLLGGA